MNIIFNAEKGIQLIYRQRLKGSERNEANLYSENVRFQSS